jgi:hypothetical protein
MSRVSQRDGVRLRQAAVVAGAFMLIMSATAPLAEFGIFPKLIVAGDTARTVANIAAHQRLYAAGIASYLVNFTCDVVIAWALYLLLAPVNRALSLLTAWFRLVYTAVAVVSLLDLVRVHQLVTEPSYLPAFGHDQLQAQVALSLGSFRAGWSMGLVLFGIHLVLLGALIWRAGYMPSVLGIVVLIDGLGWVVHSLQPYLFPDVPVGFLMITSLGELFLMVWLLGWGWRIKDVAGA